MEDFFEFLNSLPQKQNALSEESISGIQGISCEFDHRHDSKVPQNPLLYNNFIETPGEVT
jgi:hypothetical protein